MLAARQFVVLCALFSTLASAQEAPQVQGLIATRVHFPADAGEMASAATLKLLSSCTASGPATEKEWQEAPVRTCHLHLTFAKPRILTMYNSQALAVDELVLTFPLNSARLWVRSGDQYHWFAKFRPDLCKPIQELLKEAVPSEQGR
jgi:hypothetical protein